MENQPEHEASSDESDFVATEEMLSHEYDDESTINEDEEIQDDQEINNLKAEGDMPLEDLLKLYGSYLSRADNEKEEVQDKDNESAHEQTIDDINDNDGGGQRSNNSSRLWCKDLMECASNYESDEDNDYIPRVDSKYFENAKTRIGDEYQAKIPVGLLSQPASKHYNSAERCYESRLWSMRETIEPYSFVCTDTSNSVNSLSLSENEIDNYLKEYGNISGLADVSRGGKDDPDALYRLMLEKFDTKEALRYAKNRCVQPSERPSVLEMWSEEECVEFEKGLQTYKKNFKQIQDKHLKSRSIGEIVEFYYFWKKTKRYEEFNSKNKPDKKRAINQISDYSDCLAKKDSDQEKYLLGNWPGTAGESNDMGICTTASFNKMFKLNTSEAPHVLKGSWNISRTTPSSNSNATPTSSNNLDVNNINIETKSKSFSGPATNQILTNQNDDTNAT